MNPDLSGFLNSYVSTVTLVASTVTLLGGLHPRGAIKIANMSAGNDVRLKFVQANATAPAMSDTDWIETCGPLEATPFFGLNQLIAVYAWSAGTPVVNVCEAGG